MNWFSAREGVEPARYLTNLGVAAFVLKYRLARETNSPYSLNIHPRQDAQRALRLIRSRAAEWNLDPNRIGVMGFSAGGEVASMLVYSPTAGDPSATDPIDRENCVANFQIVIYPGPLGIPEKIPADAPAGILPGGQRRYQPRRRHPFPGAEYHAARRPMEVHIYEQGGHGFNLGGRSKLHSIHDWPQRLTDWMSDTGLLAAPR